ncbi:hypothetical protein DSO57_1037454 [Entomophthora muscae]|uniref:Uncharacterized protein n=1 Tax=Entomophthora muscae TaxID=34485 RepID=A0ACC2UKX0_9FUNG|nr:hypothetical protein DSO57_1037454 [Entomophthora muscae]
MAKVTSQNPFDLLGEADFEGEVKAPKVQPKKVVAAPKPAATPAQRPKAQENRAPRENNRGPRPSVPAAEGDFQAAREPRQSATPKNKSHPKGRGNPRGRGRDYDRRSAKVGATKPKNLEETAPIESETKDAESPSAEVEVNSEDNVKTLEEYYAELKAQKAQAEENAKQVRKANEGVDDSQWKGAVALKKEDEDFFAGKSSQSKARKQKEKAAKSFLEIEQKFNESNERRNDRRPARGGARGGRGGPRGPKNEASRPVNLTDQSAFPSLGA